MIIIEIFSGFIMGDHPGHFYKCYRMLICKIFINLRRCSLCPQWNLRHDIDEVGSGLLAALGQVGGAVHVAQVVELLEQADLGKACPIPLVFFPATTERLSRLPLHVFSKALLTRPLHLLGPDHYAMSSGVS